MNGPLSILLAYLPFRGLSLKLCPLKLIALLHLLVHMRFLLFQKAQAQTHLIPGNLTPTPLSPEAMYQMRILHMIYLWIFLRVYLKFLLNISKTRKTFMKISTWILRLAHLVLLSLLKNPTRIGKQTWEWDRFIRMTQTTGTLTFPQVRIACDVYASDSSLSVALLLILLFAFSFFFLLSLV